jgi:hypothetical protein
MSTFLKGFLQGIGMVVGTIVANIFGLPEIGEAIKSALFGSGGS